MQEGKIIDYLGENKYVILLPDEEEYNGSPTPMVVRFAHDYVEFEDSAPFEMLAKNGEYPYKTKGGAINWRRSRASIQIPIKTMYDVIIPMLLKNENLQSKHFEDRTYGEDDKYYIDKGLTEPRYKKGDSYPAYAYSSDAVKFIDNDEWFVTFRRRGEKLWETVKSKTYDLIKSTLKLDYSKLDL